MINETEVKGKLLLLNRKIYIVGQIQFANCDESFCYNGYVYTKIRICVICLFTTAKNEKGLTEYGR